MNHAYVYIERTPEKIKRKRQKEKKQEGNKDN